MLHHGQDTSPEYESGGEGDGGGDDLLASALSLGHASPVLSHSAGRCGTTDLPAA